MKVIIIILVLPPVASQSSDRALPMPGTADGDAISRCQVLGRAGNVHHGADQYMGQTSHKFLVRLNIPTLTCSLLTGQPVRNRLSAFQVVQGFSAPAVRCSSALMLRCTLASRGSSRSLHNSMRVKGDIKENIVSGEEVYDRATWRRMSSYIDPTLKNGKKMKRKTYEKRCEI